jgi:hypothetical protein
MLKEQPLLAIPLRLPVLRTVKAGVDITLVGLPYHLVR